MSKNFEKRVSKKDRSQINIAANIDPSIFKMHDEKVLQGALLDRIALSKIDVRKQVRTKFNDDSILELAENIKENGLIQPLVVHREGSVYVLICGERRFRAMSTIDPDFLAPCFILENKTAEELMAIQFSENSAREQLHYIDQADSIWGYKKLTGASERKIQSALGISKSEVHRCLMIAKLPKQLKEAAKEFNIEKYVLLEWDAIATDEVKKKLRKKIVEGEITKRLQLKRAISSEGAVLKAGRKTAPVKQKTISANVFIKALKEQSKNLNLDKDTQVLIKKLMEETKEMVDM
jgi:ParB family chromosome partitioning protein